MQRQGRRRFLKIFPAILPLSLSTQLAQKSRMTHTHTYTTIPCNSHATMPCTWTGYGEPLPRLPINTRERTKNREWGEDKKREEKFFGEQREASCRNGEEKGRKKERAGEDGQAAETKKKGKPEGAKLLRNELEGRNKFEKGDRGGLQRSRNRGGGFRVQS
jgi:hypothetical protein